MEKTKLANQKLFGKSDANYMESDILRNFLAANWENFPYPGCFQLSEEVAIFLDSNIRWSRNSKLIAGQNENLADTLLTAPLAAILHYISGIREKNDVQLREILTAISEIADGSIIYQQVIPQRMLIYSSPKIRDFCDAKWLLIDGTFRRCPKQFYQLNQ